MISKAKQTLFYPWHLQHQAKMIKFGGWEMPLQYQGILEEYKAVREKVGLFDICHMGEIKISGKGGEVLIQEIITNDVSLLQDGQCLYSPMCNEKAGIVDDIIVYKINNQEYLLVVNAANTDKDYNWTISFIPKMQEMVEVKNISDQTVLISVQGPSSKVMLQQLVDFNLKELNYFEFRKTTINKIPVILSRTGYTGEIGYEIFYFVQQNEKDLANKLWKTIVDTGEKYGLGLCGLGVRDLLRLEMKYSLYGQDIDSFTNPLEADLEWTVKWQKKDFIGKKSLGKIKQDGLKRKLVGLKMVSRQIPRHDFLIYPHTNWVNKLDNKAIGVGVYNKKGTAIGKITSGSFSPRLATGIGLGYMAIEEAYIGNIIEVDVRGTRAEAEIVKTPFVPSHVRD